MTTNSQVIGIFEPASEHWVGDGFPVRNLFPTNRLPFPKISPFLMLDYAGPAEFTPSDKPRGVESHPHRGFETVTIAYQGAVAHRDSAGNAGRIGPGEVQWMTAASGVLHEEFHDPEFTRTGGTFEMIQLWVNLPKAHKMSPPKYQSLTASDIPEVALPGGGVLRVIAGEFEGRRGGASTHTPLDLYDVRLLAGSKFDLMLPKDRTSAIFLLSGDVRLGEVVLAGQAKLALLDPSGEPVTLEAREATKLLVLSGEPIREPVAHYGPFVMNTREELIQAMEDFRAGRMGQLG